MELLLGHFQQMDQVQVGDVLVTDMTDPDWEPIMKKASAIITNKGGRTCHAAIVAREMGSQQLLVQRMALKFFLMEKNSRFPVQKEISEKYMKE